MMNVAKIREYEQKVRANQEKIKGKKVADMLDLVTEVWIINAIDKQQKELRLTAKDFLEILGREYMVLFKDLLDALVENGFDVAEIEEGVAIVTWEE